MPLWRTVNLALRSTLPSLNVGQWKMISYDCHCPGGRQAFPLGAFHVTFAEDPVGFLAAAVGPFVEILAVEENDRVAGGLACAGLCGAIGLGCCPVAGVGVGFCYVEFFYPGVSEHYVVAFALEFEASGDVGDSFATVVASVDTGVWTAPDLLDPLVGVSFDSVEVHCHECLFG